MRKKPGIRPAFFRKRIKDGKITVYATYARGFTDDTGNKKAEIVISAICGSHSRVASRHSKKLCDALNEAWTKFYEGDHGPTADRPV